MMIVAKMVATHGVAVATILSLLLLAGARPSFAVDGSADDVVAPAEGVPQSPLESPSNLGDVKLATGATIGGQTVAANPKKSETFVAVFEARGSCWVRTSSNAGRTWAPSKRLPMPAGAEVCGVPAVLWAPDGKRVYATYSYWVEKGLGFTKETGAVVSHSEDAGTTWSSPRVALRDRDDFARIVSIKLASPNQEKDANWVYLVAHLPGYPDAIRFRRSSDRGQSWSSGQTLLRIPNSVVADAYSPSIAGGPDGELIAVWALQSCDTACSFQVRVRRSGDYGASFGVDVPVASNNDQHVSAAIGLGGTAHIVYNVNDVGASGIYYTYSTKPPYSSWSAPIALNDDDTGNFYYAPSLTVSACGRDRSALSVVWLDDRVGLGKYNAYYTRAVARTGELWSANLRISEKSVRPTFDIYGFYLASGVAVVDNAVAVWGQAWEDYDSRLLWASRIAPRMDCP